MELRHLPLYVNIFKRKLLRIDNIQAYQIIKARKEFTKFRKFRSLMFFYISYYIKLFFIPFSYNIKEWISLEYLLH